MASTVIVGSGVMGASLAYHLAMRGHDDVLVLDRGDGPGAGSTVRATGGFRAQYATPINIRLSLLAREKLLAFRRDTGIDPGYQTVGYLWLADTPAQLEALRACQRVQVAEGLIEAMELEDEHLGWLHPALDRSGIAGAVFCPTDGYIRPFEILRGYIHAATRLGVRFEWNTVVEGIDRASDGTVRAARTHGRARAGRPHRERRGRLGRRLRTRLRARGAGRAAPAPGRAHDADRRASGRHADDHLRRRRLPPAGARRTGPAALADARRRRRAVRRSGGRRLDRRGGRQGARPGAGVEGRSDRPHRVVGRALRDVARQARPARSAPGVPELLPHRRVVGPRRDARARRSGTCSPKSSSTAVPPPSTPPRSGRAASPRTIRTRYRRSSS